MAGKIIEYKGWDKGPGDWGTREAWNAPANSFSAVNMMVARTGELYVRPGVKNVTPTTGVATGSVTGIVGSSTGTTPGIYYVQGTKVYYFNPTEPPANPATASAASFAAAPGASGQPATFTKVGGRTYIVSDDGVSYVENTTPTLTRLTAAPPLGGTHGALFGVRFTVIASRTDDSMVEYSADTVALNTWPGAANQFKVGVNSFLRACFVQRNVLQIMARGGISSVTGTFGDAGNFTLRKVSSRPGPASPANAALTLDDVIWYSEEAGTHPTAYDGSGFKTWDHIAFSTLEEDIAAGVAPFEFPSTNDVAFLTNYALGTGFEFLATAWVRLRGVWTRHEFPNTIQAGLVSQGRLAATTSRRMRQPGAAAVLDNQDNYLATTTFVFTDDGAVGVAPVFWAWSPDLERPGSEFDYFAQSGYANLKFAPERAGDLSAAQVEGRVSFPEWHGDDGAEVFVRKVVVDFRKWDCSASTTNHFDLSVEALRLYDGAESRTSATQSWDEAGALASTGGTLCRSVFTFGDQGSGNGFQIHMAAIRGVSIQRIQITLDTRPQR